MFGNHLSTNIIYNLDNQPVVDLEKKEWLLPFTTEQQNVLLKCINKGMSIKGFAYPGVTSITMEFIFFLYEAIQKKEMFVEANNKYMTAVTPLDKNIWRAVHTDYHTENILENEDAFTDEMKMRCELICNFCGVSIIGEVPEMLSNSAADQHDWFHIMVCAFCGKDICKIEKQHLEYTEGLRRKDVKDSPFELGMGLFAESGKIEKNSIMAALIIDMMQYLSTAEIRGYGMVSEQQQRFAWMDQMKKDRGLY